MHICMDILAMIAVFNCSPVSVSVSVYCIPCAHTHIWVLGVNVCSGCVCRHVQAHTHRGKLGSEIVFLPFYTATRHALSHYTESSEVFLFYFAQGEEGNTF